jgi:large subunit ribosomal protein LP1
MTQQLACTYAALLLADSGKTDAATIIAVAKAAKVEVSSGMASAFAALLKDVKIDEILKNVSFGGGAAAPAAASAGAAAPAKAAAAAAPEPEEEDDDFGMGGLF